MELSVPFKCNKNLCLFSPNGKFIAILHELKLLIKSTDNLSLKKSFQCDGPIDYIEWAADSLFVMCAAYSPRAFVHVFSLQNTSFRCKITEGAPGLVMACWGPDSRHILIIGILYVQLSIWSLVSESVQYVHYLKKGSPGLAFSREGEYLALLEQRGTRDYILVLHSHNWTPALRVECCGIGDVGGLAWCPDSSGICAWSSPPSEGLRIYWLSGEMSQQLLTTQEVPGSLGVRCVAWSPTDQFLAVGANDAQVHLINTITWCPIAKFSHHRCTTTQCCTVYEERSAPVKGAGVEGATVESQSMEAVDRTTPPALGGQFRGSAMPLPQGIRDLSFCPSGAWIASLDDSRPCVLWIWSITTLMLHSVLVQKQAISDVSWSPSGDSTLVICTSSSHISLWTPRGGVTVSPSHMSKVSKATWNPKGTMVLLQGASEASLHALP